jgi:hypothetical protein
VILSHHVLMDGLFAIQVNKPFHYFWAQQILISCKGHSFLAQTRERVGTAIGSSLARCSGRTNRDIQIDCTSVV